MGEQLYSVQSLDKKLPILISKKCPAFFALYKAMKKRTLQIIFLLVFSTAYAQNSWNLSSPDEKWMNQHYLHVGKKAAEKKIMVVSHESSRPTDPTPPTTRYNRLRGFQLGQMPRILC